MPTSSSETAACMCCAAVCARARIARSSPVISSASISRRPAPNRCGALRLSGRVTTSPPKPAEPRGRPWQDEQLSLKPAPSAAFAMMSPLASKLTRGPMPCSSVNLRWNNWRPRRTARAGSRAIRYSDEPGVLSSPRPLPICCCSDFPIAPPAICGVVCVTSVNCAWAKHGSAAHTAIQSHAPARVLHRIAFMDGPSPRARRARSCRGTANDDDLRHRGRR